ncbi:hypothetical protein GE061_003601 [Apolygus lucorum]|uniref:Choline transporter-like protein n=1 Tax=Apolygus lucorum TaxID=248454 RepID=A0A8S9X3Y2_APOLU|nr:hypothetical protein GE061_003601 [Apolygus lucorum]
MSESEKATDSEPSSTSTQDTSKSRERIRSRVKIRSPVKSDDTTESEPSGSPSEDSPKLRDRLKSISMIKLPTESDALSDSGPTETSSKDAPKWRERLKSSMKRKGSPSLASETDSIADPETSSKDAPKWRERLKSSMRRKGSPSLASETDSIADPEPSEISTKEGTKWRERLKSTMKSSVTPIARKATVSDVNQKKSIESWEKPAEEDLYDRTNHWCEDCPWLIVYLIFSFIWIILMIITWERSHLTDGLHVSLDNTRCMLICTRLVPAVRNLDQKKASKGSFHCKPNVKSEKWEGDVFYDWYEVIEPNTNTHCVEDCHVLSTASLQTFMKNCVLDERAVQDWLIAVFLTSEGNPVVYLDSVRSHYQWIAHVIFLTNGLSLFILIMPIFFCVPMVAFFVIASVTTSSILTLMLWYDLFHYIRRITSEDHVFVLSNLIYKWVTTVLGSVINVYVIFSGVRVFRRYNAIGATAALASTVIDGVTIILLECVATMVKLFFLIVLIIFLSLAIESSAVLYRIGSVFHYYISPFTWVVRVYTLAFAYWTAQLFINSQAIVIHGVIARDYFQKSLENKVIITHKRLYQYHLCTACFSALLFNYLYWTKWCFVRTPIRSRSLFGTGAYGDSFFPASRRVLDLVFTEGGDKSNMDRANPYFFLVQILVVLTVAIVCGLVFTEEHSVAVWPDLFMVSYAYFVSLSAVNVYRGAKDATFLCFLVDREFSDVNPDRRMILPDHIAIYFGHVPRVEPR